MTDSTERRDPAEVFLKYKELAEAYWKAAAGDHLVAAARRYTGVSLGNDAELREQLALMLPEVEDAADLLGIQYVRKGLAPANAGGFSFSCNFLKAAYDQRPLGASIDEVRDFLNECIGRARTGKRPTQRVSPPTPRKVVIGHGKSLLWREVKDFLRDRCHLEPDEYNMIATAGMSRKERLQQMLDAAGFAFLILTAEDEQADGTVRARENVVHEAGLFQGHLGFARAIILLEEGCTEFSNIAGLDQIRFPRENVAAAFEDIRRVLEREGLLRPSKP